MSLKSIFPKLTLALTALIGMAKAQTFTGPYGTITPTPTITPIPTTTYGYFWKNLTANNFSLNVMPTDIMGPYGWTTNGNLAIVYLFIFLSIYGGTWIQTKSIRLPSIMGILFGSMMTGYNFISGGGWFNSVASLSYAVIVLGVAGIVLYTFKKVG